MQRSRSTLVFIFTLTVIAVLLGINYFTTPLLDRFDQNQTANQAESDLTAPTPTPTPTPSNSSVQELVQSLSTEQKIAQLIAYPLNLKQVKISSAKKMSGMAESTASAAADASDSTTVVPSQLEDAAVPTEAIEAIIPDEESLLSLQPGFITLFGSQIDFNLAQAGVAAVLDGFKNQRLILPLIAVDHEGGSVQRLSGEGFTTLPDWSTACYQDEPDVRAVYQQSALELSQVGVNIVFAPVVDIRRDSSFLGSRACGDIVKTQRTAAAFIESFGQQQIMAVLKHFPGIGKLAVDPHQSVGTITLKPEDTQPFQNLLKAYPNLGVMTAHVRLRGKLNDLPCSLSSTCLQTFPSVYPSATLFADALDMEAALSTVDLLALTSNRNPSQALTNDQVGDEVATDSAQAGSVFSQIDTESVQQPTDLALVAEQAVWAGNHVLVFGKGVTTQELESVVLYLADRYESDKAFKKRVNNSLAKVLNMKNIEQN